jgi:hypothetical protein
MGWQMGGAIREPWYAPRASFNLVVRSSLATRRVDGGARSPADKT